jgi:transcriptional antiterminator NusG
MPEEAKWYIIHTYSGYENKVASNLMKIVENRGLQHLIQDVFIPTETVVEIKENKKREVERKTFPGYVIIKMVLNDESWYVVRNTRGCTGFVGPSSKPVPITDEEIQRLGIERKHISVDYDLGDLVQIIDGPLKGFTGKVDKLDKEKNYVCILISMFGRDTPVDLALDQIKLQDI